MNKAWAGMLLSVIVVVGSIGWIMGTAVDAQRSDFSPEGNRASAIASAASQAPAASPTPPSTSASPTSTPSPSAETLLPAPMSLRIPAIDVSTSIVPVGLDSNDNMEIPEDIRLAGWYDLGVPPGADAGSAVLVAHRDGRVQGRGVFYSIGNLEPGDRIIVTRADGSKVKYIVASRELLNKKNFTKAAPELFAIDGPHRLTLISCGGTYDKANGGYQANVIVTAMAESVA